MSCMRCHPGLGAADDVILVGHADATFPVVLWRCLTAFRRVTGKAIETAARDAGEIHSQATLDL